MPNVKTTTLSGTETKVTLPQNYPYCFITNMSEAEIYASGNPGVVPYADGVYTIPAGTEIRISPEASGDTLWLLGSGKVQIRGEEIAAPTSFKRSVKGGEISFSGDYNDLTNKPDIPVPSEVIDSNSTNKTVSTSKSVFDYVNNQVSGLVGAAPDTLDTLEELAAAIQDNKDVIDVLDAAITNKADKNALSNYAALSDLSAKQDIITKPPIIDNSVDWNTLTETAIYPVGIQNGESLSDSSTHGLSSAYPYGFLIVMARLNYNGWLYQLYINDRSEVYIRSLYTSWRSWVRIDAGVGVTLTKPAISDPTTDWNTITETGFYTIGYDGLIKADSHGPLGVTGWGLLSVINTGLGSTSSACIRQIYEAGSAGLYTRNKRRINGEWSPWYVYRCETYTPS